MPYTPRPHPEAPRRSRADELDYPSEPTGLYALADDLRRDPRVLPRSQEFEREIGKVGALRKVRTTLGRWRSDPARATPPCSAP